LSRLVKREKGERGKKGRGDERVSLSPLWGKQLKNLFNQ